MRAGVRRGSLLRAFSSARQMSRIMCAAFCRLTPEAQLWKKSCALGFSIMSAKQLSTTGKTYGLHDSKKSSSASSPAGCKRDYRSASNRSMTRPCSCD